MNLKKLSNTLLKQTITAMHILLRNYENDGHLTDCPLCKTMKFGKSPMYTACNRCPWSFEIKGKATQLTGAKCTNYVSKNGYKDCVSNLRNGFSPKWNKLRISQLSVWIKAYRAELNRRGIHH